MVRDGIDRDGSVWTSGEDSGQAAELAVPWVPDIEYEPSAEATEHGNFYLWRRRQFTGFTDVEVVRNRITRHGLEPASVAVRFNGGHEDIHPAHSIAYVLRPRESLDVPRIIVNIYRAGHIWQLHAPGHDDSGSGFPAGKSLDDVLHDIGRALPPDAATREETRWEVEVDMGGPYGHEGLASMDELEDLKAITASDRITLHKYAHRILELNLADGSEAYTKRANFAKFFNDRNDNCKLFLAVIRDGAVIVPHVIGTARPTSKVYVSLAPTPDNKTVAMHTCAPGRSMPRHPIPKEHHNRHRRFDYGSFFTAQGEWLQHAMIVSKQKAVELGVKCI